MVFFILCVRTEPTKWVKKVECMALFIPKKWSQNLFQTFDLVLGTILSPKNQFEKGVHNYTQIICDVF